MFKKNNPKCLENYDKKRNFVEYKVRVHERTHATSTDVSTCVLNGVGACVSLKNCFFL